MRIQKLAMLVGITAAVVAVSTASPSYAGIFCFLTRCDTVPHAPEIDPTMLSGAITVLVGGGLMLAERFRRR
ncbi:MAG TPA: hypothetical protein VLV15_00160 [Dongiaceae bacterium]|nr:hypothetical protein [Dongiaceae bacterium]